MLDFIPLVTAFVATLIGIIGNKWDKEKTGLRRLTWTGWIAVVLGVVALVHGIWTLSDKNRQIADVTRVKQIAYQEIIDGIDFMLLHLADNEVRSMNSNAEVFARLRDPAYLEQLGRQSIVNWTGEGMVFDGAASPGFTHAYQLFDFNISRGEHLLNDVLLKYSHLMEPATIIRINNVLRDAFFRAKYKFSHNQIYLDQAVDDEKRTYEDSPWGTLGLYYFNAVYDGPAKRKGKYDAYFRVSSATRLCWSKGIGGCDAFMKLCMLSSGCKPRPAKGEPARAGSKPCDSLRKEGGEA